MGIYHMYVQLRTQPTCPGLLGILSNATEAKKKKGCRCSEGTAQNRGKFISKRRNGDFVLL